VRSFTPQRIQGKPIRCFQSQLSLLHASSMMILY
jgi:hypothetical protein